MMLHVEHVKKAFGETDVLRDVSLSVNRGDVVAILGPSGSGKTTLLRCLNFLETADGGTMTFDGETFDLAHTGKKEIARIRRKTAFVFQNYNLFANRTALQNVTEGLVRRIERKRIRANFPAVSSSAWRLRGRWRPNRRSSISTSRPARLTRN